MIIKRNINRIFQVIYLSALLTLIPITAFAQNQTIKPHNPNPIKGPEKSDEKPTDRDKRKNMVPEAHPSPADYIIDGQGAVDLGIGTLWSITNMNATNPQDPGAHYAWGELNPKTCFLKGTELLGKSRWSIAGDPKHDAATANWGALWSIPTKEEFKTLQKNCKWRWSKMGSQLGYEVTGPNGHSIFLPAAGEYRSEEYGNPCKNYEKNKEGDYWCSDSNFDFKCYDSAYVAIFDREWPSRGDSKKRDCGGSLRPVIQKEIYATYTDAHKDNPEAMYKLGSVLEQRNGEEAEMWLERAANGGNVEACIKIAPRYASAHSRDSLLRAENMLKFVYPLHEKLKEYYAELEYKLGLYTPKEQAIKYYEKGASLGHAPSQCNAGICYQMGWGVEKNIPKALDLYEKSARKAHPKAEYLYAKCLWYGSGIKQNKKEAEQWLRKASAHGYKEADKMLGGTLITVYSKRDKNQLIAASVIHTRNGQTLKAVVTNIDGEATLENVKSGDVLVFRYVKHKTLEFTVSTAPNPNRINEIKIEMNGGNPKSIERRTQAH